MRENQSRDRKSQTKGPRLKPLPKCYAAFQWPKGHCSFRIDVKRTCDWSSHADTKAHDLCGSYGTAKAVPLLQDRSKRANYRECRPNMIHLTSGPTGRRTSRDPEDVTSRGLETRLGLGATVEPRVTWPANGYSAK